MNAPLRLIRRPALKTFVLAVPFCVRVTWRMLPIEEPPKVAMKISAFPSAMLGARFALDTKDTTDPSADRLGIHENVNTIPAASSCVVEDCTKLLLPKFKKKASG